MNIAFVINEMAGGGAERVISVLANHMVEYDIEVSILMTAGGRVEYELDPRVRVIQVGEKAAGNPLNLIHRISMLRNKMKRGNFDVVIAFAADTGLYTLLANAFLKNKLYMSERCDPASYNHKLLMWIAYFGAKKVIFQTNDAREYFSGKIKNNGVIIPNPLNTSLPSPYCGLRKKEIVAVGRLEPQKNYNLLIDAYSIFHVSHPDYSLHIFGKGYLKEELLLRCRALKLQDSVVLEGFCSDVNSRIREAAMYVMSSDFEGMPNALMEAMALGLPVISTDCPVGGPRECISDGENGLLVKCNDVKGLADAMSKLADDIEFAAELGKKAMAIREQYDVQTICGKWLEAIGN